MLAFHVQRVERFVDFHSGSCRRVILIFAAVSSVIFVSFKLNSFLRSWL
jgi:hypothetical protein